MATWIIPTALLLAVFALPFGLLPSALLFRDLANGATSEGAERLYRVSVWGGLLIAYVAAATTIALILSALA